MQPHCISLPKFANCEIADRLQSTTARLGYRFVCTTSAFAQKRDARPVGGRGISAFSADFFLEIEFSRYSQEQARIAASRSDDVTRRDDRYTVYTYSISKE